MATQDYAASVQGAAIRVTRLDAAGGLKNGPLDSYTTSAFLRMSFTPEYEDGEEITEKAANGTVCVSYKAPDVLKRVTMELAICEPDPELTALLAGGVLLSRDNSNASSINITGTPTIGSGSVTATTSPVAHGLAVGDNITITGLSATGDTLNGIKVVTEVNGFTFKFTTDASGAVSTSSPTVTKRADTSVGWAAPLIGDDPAGNGVAIECWSFAVANGKRAATNPFFHWVFPYARLRASGDRVIENGLLANTFEGYGIGNIEFGTGPDGRWEFPGVTDRPYAYARTGYSPSQSLLKGFYQWSESTGVGTPTVSLPVADVDLPYNVPGGASYIATDSQDIITTSDEN